MSDADGGRRAIGATWTLGPLELGEALAAASYRAAPRRTTALTLACVALGALTAIAVAVDVPVLLGAMGPVFFFAAAPAIRLRLLGVSLWCASSVLRAPVTLRAFSSRAIEWDSAYGDAGRMLFGAFVRRFETRRLFVLVRARSGALLIVPKRALPSDAIPALREAIAGRHASEVAEALFAADAAADERAIEYTLTVEEHRRGTLLLTRHAGGRARWAKRTLAVVIAGALIAFATTLAHHEWGSSGVVFALAVLVLALVVGARRQTRVLRAMLRPMRVLLEPTGVVIESATGRSAFPRAAFRAWMPGDDELVVLVLQTGTAGVLLPRRALDDRHHAVLAELGRDLPKLGPPERAR